MATIKSYTNISQSKKLAKILPLESADMKYKEYTSGLDYSSKHCDVPSVGHPFSRDIPCWSLAALLGILLNENMLVKTTDSEYYCIAKDVTTKHYNNPVDACVAVIEKLYEMKMI